MTGTETPDTAPWAQWLRKALADSGRSQTELGRAGIVRSESTVSKWLKGVGTPEDANVVIQVARFLRQDAIPALYASGYTEVADFAKELRDDTPGALIRREMAAIADDPYLGRLDAWAARGVITDEERDRRRADYLDLKAKDIEGMAEIYTAEVERIRARRGEPNGSPRRTAL